MKKGWIFFIVLILLTPGVLALSVSLSAPSSGNTTNMTSIIFTCTATDSTYAISGISLYMNTSSSPWTQVANQINTSTIANFLVSSLTQGTYIWNCFATNTNNENVSASSNYSLTVSTLAFSGIIPNQSITEDINSSTLFDLDSYFTGASYYTFSGNTSILIFIDSNNQLTISPGANFSGSQNITITGRYGSSSVTSNEILVNVIGVNDAPFQIANFSNLTLAKNTVSTLDMKEYFKDHEGNNLTYTITQASHITLTQNETKITITPQTDWQGKENATISASDSSLSTSGNIFTITVGSAADNTAPTINSFSPDTDPALEVGDTQDFRVSISDADEDTLVISWYANDEKQIETGESFSFTATEEGVFTIKITISDGTTETTQTWTVTVGDISIEVDSILGEQSSGKAVCGNAIVEAEENCSTCALDVVCDSGYVCNQGNCEKKESAVKSIFILIGVSILILIVAIGIYYFTTLKKGGRKQDNTSFQYTPAGTAPPTEYTDFYKK